MDRPSQQNGIDILGILVQKLSFPSRRNSESSQSVSQS